MSDLKNGAEAYQRTDLPPTTQRNCKSAIENGGLMSDKIVSWIQEGFVVGPFSHAPVEGFRTNPLMAIVKDGKIRPVINMSSPVGSSFNDNLRWKELEKIHMTTAKEFSYTVKEAGKNALMTKFDVKDAYKLIPARMEDLRLQSFSWMGKMFVETQMIFGGIPSVSNFDRLGHCLVDLAAAECSIGKNQIHRTLDDIPVVGGQGKGQVEEFTIEFQKICKMINVPLAENCDKKEKAFTMETRGTVLGVIFDTQKWSGPCRTRK